MRLLTFFFACYFACLSCLSCADEAPVRPAQTQTTVAATPHTDCLTGPLADWCSPLCQCQCCGGAVLSFASPVPAAYPHPIQWARSQQHAQLVVAAPTRAPGAVWQPPRA